MKHYYAKRIDSREVARLTVTGVEQGEFGYLERLFVDPTWRGHGFASELLDRVCSEADAERARLYATPIAEQGMGIDTAAVRGMLIRRGFVGSSNPTAPTEVVRDAK